MIQEGQTGVVLQFGKYSHTTRPGINWRMPWPVQSHEVVNLSSIRSVEVGRTNLIKASNLKDSSMLTEDENIIDVKFAVQYRLKDASEYLFNNKDPDAAVVQSAETAVREIVGKSKMDNVLYENREKLAIDLNASIQKILDSYKAGIFITSVTVQNVQPPEQVQAAFDDAVKAGQDRERLKNEGQAYANDIVPKARGAADRLMQEAEGYKAKVTATAEGDATRFKLIQVEYARAPQVTRERMYIDAMQEIYNNVTKVMVDQRSSNGSLLYLPLDKLIQQVGPNTAPLPLQTSNTMANTPANTSSPNPNSPIVNPAAAPASRSDNSGLRSRER
jgi:membrane protease subunit HflK